MQHITVPVPRQPVGAGGVGRRHPIFLARLRQGMAADPRPPRTCCADLHDRILDGERIRAGEHDSPLAGRQPGRLVRVDRLDPPVLRLGCGAADVQPPAALRSSDEARALERVRPESVTLDPRDRRETLAVLGAGHDGLHAAGLRALGAGRAAHPVAQPVDAVVEDRVWCAGPVAGASIRRRDDDAPLLHGRQWHAWHDLAGGRHQREAREGRSPRRTGTARCGPSPPRPPRLASRRRAARAPRASSRRATRRYAGTPPSSQL